MDVENISWMDEALSTTRRAFLHAARELGGGPEAGGFSVFESFKAGKVASFRLRVNDPALVRFANGRRPGDLADDTAFFAGSFVKDKAMDLFGHIGCEIDEESLSTDPKVLFRDLARRMRYFFPEDLRLRHAVENELRDIRVPGASLDMSAQIFLTKTGDIGIRICARLAAGEERGRHHTLALMKTPLGNREDFFRMTALAFGTAFPDSRPSRASLGRKEWLQQKEAEKKSRRLVLETARKRRLGAGSKIPGRRPAKKDAGLSFLRKILPDMTGRYRKIVAERYGIPEGAFVLDAETAKVATGEMVRPGPASGLEYLVASLHHDIEREFGRNILKDLAKKYRLPGTPERLASTLRKMMASPDTQDHEKTLRAISGRYEKRMSRLRRPVIDILPFAVYDAKRAGFRTGFRLKVEDPGDVPASLFRKYENMEFGVATFPVTEDPKDLLRLCAASLKSMTRRIDIEPVMRKAGESATHDGSPAFRA